MQAHSNLSECKTDRLALRNTTRPVAAHTIHFGIVSGTCAPVNLCAYICKCVFLYGFVCIYISSRQGSKATTDGAPAPPRLYTKLRFLFESSEYQHGRNIGKQGHEAKFRKQMWALSGRERGCPPKV